MIVMNQSTQTNETVDCCEKQVETVEKTTDSFQPGKPGTKYVMVFECPTVNEKREQRPVVGITGCNLCRLLELVRNRDEFMRNRLDGLRKCEVRIVNASIHDHESGNEVEGWELDEHAPILWKYMSACEYVFLFGVKAERGFALARGNKSSRFKKVISVYHLSPNGIQHIHIKGKGRKGSSEWTWRRIHVIAEYLCEKLRSKGDFFSMNDFRKYLNYNGLQ